MALALLEWPNRAPLFFEVASVVSVKIGSNIASLGAQRRLGENTYGLSRTFERLSSGQRINRASDDAAGLAIADSLRAGSRIFNQAVRNLSDGISLLNIADSAIENLSTIITRLEELAEQSANGTYGVQQRKALDAEAQALSLEFFRISKTTRFNGIDLLSGSFNTVNLQAGFGENSVLSAGVGGAIGTGRFNLSGSVALGTNPNGLATADYNGDGIMDIAANTGAEVNVALGLGGGSFASLTSYTMGTFTGRPVTGDFNNDGIMDLVTANSASSDVRVLLGRGDGSFGAYITSSTGFTGNVVDAADFNQDGALDLAVQSTSLNSLKIMLGANNGTFTVAGSYAVGDYPGDRAIADYNGDSILDIATANLSSDDVSLLFGRGDGSFDQAVTIAVADSPSAIVAGDFNRDGAIDMAVANSLAVDRLNILLNQGDGTFATPVSYVVGDDPQSVVAGDFNGDGILDLATSDFNSTAIGVLSGRGDGTFNTRVSYSTSGSFPSDLVTADFTGDGVLDLMSTSLLSSTVRLFHGDTQDGIAPLLPFSLTTMADARQALPVFKSRRDALAAQRGEIGAFQSRIHVATKVLQVGSENYKSAESRIRDADIAGDSADLVRRRILQQASASVLAQANQQPAIAISLLQI